MAKDWVPVDKGHVTSAHGAGVIELRPSSTPLGRFIGLSIFCLVWNGFLIAIGWAAFDGGSSRDACLFAFLSVFAIIGVIVLVAVVKQFLALFNPRPTVTISPSDIRAGTRVEVSWSNQGRYDRITKLSIELEGKEEAKYRRGTKTTTDRSVFARVPLVETTKQIDIARGKRTVTIPDGAIHSLDLSNNKVIWLLKVTGEIANWPDVSEEMPLTVGAAETRSPMDFGGAAQEVTSSDGTLTLSVAGKEFTPGAEVKGWFAWEPAEKREWIEARLFYYTSGKGTRDVRVVQQTRIDSPDERGRREFSFRLPEGPFSFSGTLISLLWAVELVDHKGRKDEETVMAELVVSPTGEEIVFHSLEEKKP